MQEYKNNDEKHYLLKLILIITISLYVVIFNELITDISIFCFSDNELSQFFISYAIVGEIAHFIEWSLLMLYIYQSSYNFNILLKFYPFSRYITNEKE